MKVGVISDTHIASGGIRKFATKIIQKVNDDAESLKVILDRYFRGVSAILHAGDVVDWSVLEILEGFGKVYAVAGNMDPADVRSRLPQKSVIKLGNFQIGLIHGWGSPHGLSVRVREQFAVEKLDCIVFGHSHQPYAKVEEGILMFNPGSPTDRRFAPKRTLGILHLDDKIHGEHIELE